MFVGEGPSRWARPEREHRKMQTFASLTSDNYHRTLSCWGKGVEQDHADNERPDPLGFDAPKARQ